MMLGKEALRALASRFWPAAEIVHSSPDSEIPTIPNSEIPTKPDSEIPSNNSEEDKFIDVEGDRYDAGRVRYLRAALEEVTAYRRQTVYDLTRLAEKSLFGSLQISEQLLACLSNLTGTPALQALFIIDALRRTKDLDGDVCEYGVAFGHTSALIATVLNSVGSTKRLWLYDSFAGLPKPSEKDLLVRDIYGLGAIEKYEGLFSVPETVVQAELDRAGFLRDRVMICKGWIERAALLTRSPPAISFCYLDMDFYQSTKDVLGALIPRMPPGGIAIADDYESFSSGVKTAIDETMAEFPGAFAFERPFDDKFAILTRQDDGRAAGAQ
jgi:hypothetical protein